EFDQIREEHPEILMSGNFWLDFIRTYPRHLWLIVLGRSVITFMILASVLASARILDVTNTVTAAVWLLVFYTVVQVIMKVVNAWTSLLKNQLLVCTRTFVTLRVNAKLLYMGTLSSDEFSMGNLKTLISSDIY
ncbi:MAG TPA: hypothetical protein DCM54_17100, partial [Gammaproteobacteria bacterium]|nr:hypothetical protein [Gammaproteobacteria bacterium]